MDTPEQRAAEDAIADVCSERRCQHAKWGPQDHPDGTGGPAAKQAADDARAVCQRHFAAGQGSWADILLEEVYEALAEEHHGKLRDELIQVAAVAVAWAEALDQRQQPAEDSHVPQAGISAVTFVDAVLAGDAAPADLDAWVERWHGTETALPLHTWLGLTWEEYRTLGASDRNLTTLLHSRTEGHVAADGPDAAA